VAPALLDLLEDELPQAVVVTVQATDRARRRRRRITGSPGTQGF
jgi:hypothetical protein